MSEQKIHIEKLLAQGQTVQIYPQGYSMYPMFIPGRDSAILKRTRPSELRRGDVVLYRREHGILVLHRIYRITQAGFYMVGDNQSEIEGPLRSNQIYGRLAAFVRNGKEISVRHPGYRAVSGLWLALLPVRPLFFRLSGAVRRFWGRRH